MIKPTSSQQIESGQTKEISQHVENDATSRPLNSSVSFEFTPKVRQDGDHVADGDTKDVENQGPEMGQVQNSIASGRTKKISHMAHFIYNYDLFSSGHRRVFHPHIGRPRSSRS